VRLARGIRWYFATPKINTGSESEKVSTKSKVWLAVFSFLRLLFFPFDGANKMQIQLIYYSKFGVFKLACCSAGFAFGGHAGTPVPNLEAGRLRGLNGSASHRPSEMLKVHENAGQAPS
jgi:hypothetical protein